MTDFHYSVDQDGIATILWDIPEKSMNVLNMQGVAELREAVTRALADENVIGAIITSGKKDFAGGMDLNVIAKMKEDGGAEPAKAVYEGIMSFHNMLNTIERAGADSKTLKGGKPIAWAGRGVCAGIGTEIALACHKRFISDAPNSRIGLPEIKLGIFPGAGGTTRVVRMVGLLNSAPILLEGQLFPAQKAKSVGLVDELVSDDALLESAKSWIKSASADEIIKPWYQKSFKLPGGAPYHPAGIMNWIGASAMVTGNTQGAYPAAKALLSAAYEGALVSFDEAIEIEARYFTNILMNPSSKAMIETLFIDKTALEKGDARPKSIPDQSVQSLAVLGAGMMGSGIAFIAAKAGITVILLDRDEMSAQKGHDAIAKILQEGVSRKKLTQEKADEQLARIQPTADYADIHGVDLVIEAVFEEPKIKAEAMKNALSVIGEDCIFASNTSTLPITDLAQFHPKPENFIGMHFFSPVHKMPLLEIIQSPKTGERAVAKALDFARQTKKTPIVVNDARFFYANRCIIPYLNEGIRMVAEGIPPAMIENAAKQLGFPVGPLQLTDETSIDLGVKIAKATKAALGADYDDGADGVLFSLFDKERLGRKANAGFYDYDEKGKRIGLWSGIAQDFPQKDTLPDFDEVKDRLLLIQVLEALRALEENVLQDVREGDVGAIMGWGFAPWSGGPFHYIDMMGAKETVDRLQALANSQGARFTPPQILQDYAKNDRKFCER